MPEENKNVLDQMFQEKLKDKEDVIKENTFNYVAVVDRSGSMNSIRSDAMGGINTFIEDQKKEGGNATFSMVQFDDTYGDPQYWLKPINEVELLTNETYIPRGMTALRDAIGKTIANIRELRASGEMKGDVQFIIQTDGHENSSKEYKTNEEVKALVDAVKEEGWGDFIFLGANIDAFATGGSIGVSANTTMNFAANTEGTQAAYGYASVQSRARRYDATLDQNVVREMKKKASRGEDASKELKELNEMLEEAKKSK